MIPLALLLACAGGSDDAGTSDSGASDTTDSADSGTSDGGADSGITAGDWVQLGQGTAEGADVAIADDGTVYATWVHGDQQLLAVSEDGGRSFSDPVVAFSGAGAYVREQSHPNIVVSADRVAIAAPSVSRQRIWVADRETLDFGMPDEIGLGVDAKFEAIFLTAHFAPDGGLWAVTHAFPSGDGWSDGWKAVAREADGWQLQDATGATAGEPCECCPHDLAFRDDGAPVLAFRNNLDDIRDTWTCTGDSEGDFEAGAPAGFEEWNVPYCPTQGPRLDIDPDGRARMIYNEESGADWQAWVVTSDDGGATWGPALALAPEAGHTQRSPSLAADGDAVWATYVSGITGAYLLASSDGGATFAAPVELISGAGPLDHAEVAANAGVAGVIGGTEDDGGAWYLPLATGD